MNKWELIGKFVTYGILGALGMVSPILGYLELYEKGGFLVGFVFFMINMYLMVRGISIIVGSKQ